MVHQALIKDTLDVVPIFVRHDDHDVVLVIQDSLNPMNNLGRADVRSTKLVLRQGLMVYNNQVLALADSL